MRIYPDEIAVTQMTAKLTQSEFDDAKQFWKEWKKVKGNDMLCHDYEIGRASCRERV